MDLKDLKRQHQEILSVAETIEKLLTKEELGTKAFDVSLKLGELSGKISIHLNAEDKFLYPKLLKFPDEEVQLTARRFVDEMGNLAKVFSDYKTKYLSATKIKADIKGFIEETRAVFTALHKRIELEEKELYQLLSK